MGNAKGKPFHKVVECAGGIVLVVSVVGDVVNDGIKSGALKTTIPASRIDNGGVILDHDELRALLGAAAGRQPSQARSDGPWGTPAMTLERAAARARTSRRPLPSSGCPAQALHRTDARCTAARTAGTYTKARVAGTAGEGIRTAHYVVGGGGGGWTLVRCSLRDDDPFARRVCRTGASDPSTTRRIPQWRGR